MKMALSDYREELAKTAAAIAAPGTDCVVEILKRLLTSHNISYRKRNSRCR